jgi:hypothetical protein
MTSLHRGLNLQPVGRSESFGTLPGMVKSFFRPTLLEGRDFNSALV